MMDETSSPRWITGDLPCWWCETEPARFTLPWGSRICARCARAYAVMQRLLGL